MKAIKVFALCALIAIGNQATAKTTPIAFAKGSYCGSFEGDFTGRTFTLATKAKQTIFVNAKDSDYVADIIIIDPKGRKYKAGGAEFEFTTKVKGTHKIKIIPRNDSVFANIEFCAY